MARADIRKLATFVDEIHQEAGRAISPPVRRSAAVAVIANPFAGQFAEDLSDLTEIGAELGGLLGARAVAPRLRKGWHWCRRQRNAAVRDGCSTSRSATRMRPMCAAISTVWKCR